MDQILERLIDKAVSVFSLYEVVALAMIAGMAKAVIKLWERANQLEDRCYSLLATINDDDRKRGDQ